MFSVKIDGKEYKIKFGYRVLCKTDLIDKVINTSKVKEEDHIFQSMISTVAELMLAGLQKEHKEEFGWETDSEKEEAMDKVFELMDKYEEESTEDKPQDCYDLFEKLSGELLKNGFLSKFTQSQKKTAEKVNATKIPQDHKQKK